MKPFSAGIFLGNNFGFCRGDLFMKLWGIFRKVFILLKCITRELGLSSWNFLWNMTKNHVFSSISFYFKSVSIWRLPYG